MCTFFHWRICLHPRTKYYYHILLVQQCMLDGLDVLNLQITCSECANQHRKAPHTGNKDAQSHLQLNLTRCTDRNMHQICQSQSENSNNEQLLEEPALHPLSIQACTAAPYSLLPASSSASATGSLSREPAAGPPRPWVAAQIAEGRHDWTPRLLHGAATRWLRSRAPTRTSAATRKKP